MMMETHPSFVDLETDDRKPSPKNIYLYETIWLVQSIYSSIIGSISIHYNSDIFLLIFGIVNVCIPFYNLILFVTNNVLQLSPKSYRWVRLILFTIVSIFLFALGIEILRLTYCAYGVCMFSFNNLTTNFNILVSEWILNFITWVVALWFVIKE